MPPFSLLCGGYCQPGTTNSNSHPTASKPNSYLFPLYQFPLSIPNSPSLLVSPVQNLVAIIESFSLLSSLLFRTNFSSSGRYSFHPVLISFFQSLQPKCSRIPLCWNLTPPPHSAPTTGFPSCCTAIQQFVSLIFLKNTTFVFSKLKNNYMVFPEF